MKKKIAQLSQLIGLLSILWICYFLTSFFLNHQEKVTHFHPPVNSQLSVCINGDDLSTKIAFNSLILSKDLEVSNLLRNNIQLNNPDKRQKLLGADLFSSVHFFIDELEGEKLSGYIFNIDQPKLWDKNSSVYFGSKSFSKRIESSGIILTSETLSKSKLESYFKKTKFNQNNGVVHESAFSLQMRYSSGINYNKTIQNISSNVRINNRSIITEGNIILSKSVKLSPLSFSLSPSNFHIDSRFIPKVWNDTLIAWAKRYVTEIPSISALSLNYSGLEIQSTHSGVLPLPNMELILEFNEEFSIQNFIKSTETRGDVDIHLMSNYFKIGPKIYYLQQLSPTTIYIGTTKEPKIISKTISSVISIDGAPHFLTDIKGSRMMLTLLNMNNEFSQLKQLLINIESVKGNLRLKGNQPMQYNATIKFKTEKNALDELLKLFLNAQSNS